MNRAGFKEGLSTNNKKYKLDNEEAVRNIMIDIIKEKYGEEAPVIRLVQCKNASKRLCTIALNILKRKELNNLTPENIKEATRVIKGYDVGDAPKIEFGRNEICYGFDEPDYLGLERKVYNGFNVCKKGDNEYIFIDIKSKEHQDALKSYAITRIFNDSGLQTAEICSWIKSENNGEYEHMGYILEKPEIREIRDLYTLNYKRSNGRVIVEEDGRINFNKDNIVDDFTIYTSSIKMNEDPCYIPEIEGVKTGSIDDNIKAIPTSEEIDLRFEGDCKRSKYFRDLPVIKEFAKKSR